MSMRELMIKKLSALEFISITTDLWTSKYQKKSYGGFTAHGISINMKPIAIKLGIHEISIAHTAENLEIFIKKVLRDFSIYEKVLFYAVDNASVMRKCFTNMKKDFIGCFNHLFLDLKVVRKEMAKQNTQLDSDSELSDFHV